MRLTQAERRLERLELSKNAQELMQSLNYFCSLTSFIFLECEIWKYGDLHN